MGKVFLLFWLVLGIFLSGSCTASKDDEIGYTLTIEKVAVSDGGTGEDDFSAAEIHFSEIVTFFCLGSSNNLLLFNTEGKVSLRARWLGTFNRPSDLPPITFEFVQGSLTFEPLESPSISNPSLRIPIEDLDLTLIRVAQQPVLNSSQESNLWEWVFYFLPISYKLKIQQRLQDNGLFNIATGAPSPDLQPFRYRVRLTLVVKDSRGHERTLTSEGTFSLGYYCP
jgi:hypothetical protein